MKKDNSIQNDSKAIYLVPQVFLEELLEGQEKILQALSGRTEQKETIGDYISENDAKEILGRKATWFWNLRKTGKLKYTKVGNKIFYSKNDILIFIEGNKGVSDNG